MDWRTKENETFEDDKRPGVDGRDWRMIAVSVPCLKHKVASQKPLQADPENRKPKKRKMEHPLAYHSKVLEARAETENKALKEQQELLLRAQMDRTWSHAIQFANEEF